jgi:mRNA-degrading endonuclease RelE of RelBE toxin-antitoxin system
MSYKIATIDVFERKAKKLLKKYASLKEELIELQNDLLQNPTMGTLIAENTYKIRLAVKSKGKGKSSGMRVITHIVELVAKINESEFDTIIFLLTIYDKSEIENISDNELQSLIKDVEDELQQEE